MVEPVIRIENLRKEYVTGLSRKKSVALHGLDLSVEDGEVFGFIGHNGAGKTTAIKILMGLNFATSGRAFLFGKPHDDPSVKARVGFLPERPYFYDYLTASEFLHFYGRLFRLPTAVRQQRIDELLALVDLASALHTPLRRFSKGMLQRIGVAQALINDPDLVILDEPMSGLDPMGRLLIRDVILSLKARGKTVFFSTHILSDIEALCDRVAMLGQGRLLEIGRVDDLLTKRTRYVEMQVDRLTETQRGLLPTAVSEVRDHPTSSLLRVDDPASIQVVLRALLDAGIVVREVVARRETLEELFVAEARAARQGDRTHP